MIEIDEKIQTVESVEEMQKIGLFWFKIVIMESNI